MSFSPSDITVCRFRFGLRLRYSLELDTTAPRVGEIDCA
jgi:hypothetical protein